MRSPINTHGAIVATLAMRGMIELSAIRRLRTPLTRCLASTTLGGSKESRDRSSPLLLGRPGASRLHLLGKSKPCLSLRSRRVDAACV